MKIWPDAKTIGELLIRPSKRGLGDHIVMPQGNNCIPGARISIESQKIASPNYHPGNIETSKAKYFLNRPVIKTGSLYRLSSVGGTEKLFNIPLDLSVKNK